MSQLTVSWGHPSLFCLKHSKPVRQMWYGRTPSIHCPVIGPSTREYRCPPNKQRLSQRTYTYLVCPLVGIGTPPPPLHSKRARGYGSPNSDDWRKSLALCLLFGVYHCQYIQPTESQLNLINKTNALAQQHSGIVEFPLAREVGPLDVTGADCVPGESLPLRLMGRGEEDTPPATPIYQPCNNISQSKYKVKISVQDPDPDPD